MSLSRHSALQILRSSAIVVLGGLVLGGLTSFGQTYLPAPFTQLANSYSVWLFGSFVAGWALSSWAWALLGGVGLQLFALAGYYAVTTLRFNAGTGGWTGNAIWLAGAVCAGPLVGLAGQSLRTRYPRWQALLGTGGMAVLFLSEAAHNTFVLHYRSEGVCFAVVTIVFMAAVLPLLRRSRPSRH